MKWHTVADGDLPEPDNGRELLLYVFSPLLREGFQYHYCVGCRFEDAAYFSGARWRIDANRAKAHDATVIAWAEIVPYPTDWIDPANAMPEIGAHVWVKNAILDNAMIGTEPKIEERRATWTGREWLELDRTWRDMTGMVLLAVVKWRPAKDSPYTPA